MRCSAALRSIILPILCRHETEEIHEFHSRKCQQHDQAQHKDRLPARYQNFYDTEPEDDTHGEGRDVDEVEERSDYRDNDPLLCSAIPTFTL